MWQKPKAATLLTGLALDPSRSYIYLAGYDKSLGSDAADQRAITWKLDSDDGSYVRAAHEAYNETRQSVAYGVAVDKVSKYVYSVGYVIEAPYATMQPQLQQRGFEGVSGQLCRLDSLLQLQIRQTSYSRISSTVKTASAVTGEVFLFS